MSLQSSILTCALALVATCMPLAAPANAAVVVGGDYAGADLSPNDGDILSGTFTNVGTFTVQAGTTVFVNANVDLSVSAANISIAGTLDGTGKGLVGGAGGPFDHGGASGTGPGSGGGGAYGNAVGAGGGGGGGYGGTGGVGACWYCEFNFGGPGGVAYGAAAAPGIEKGSGGGGAGSHRFDFGGIGGAGGAGGSSVHLTASTINVSGTIRVDGQGGLTGIAASQHGSSSGGGGSGGGIWLEGSDVTLTGRGVLSAQGGDGGDRLTGSLSPSTWAHGGGGGGGGRIKVSASASLCDTGTKNVDGGAAGVSDAMTYAQATGGATGTVDTSVTSCSRPGQTLTAFSPARVWVGLKNSDFAGLRLDLKAEVFVNYDTNPPIASGQVNNVKGGSSGFNNAVLSMIPLALTGGPVTFPESDPLMLRISVRRTCSGGGHNSGTVRLWYGGRLIDSGASRDAGSRFYATIDGTTTDYFLRTGFAISTTAGTSKTSIDAAVNSTSPCPNRPFTSFGTWSIAP